MAKRVRIVLDNKGDFHVGQWIEYADASGRHYAQPDVYVVLDEITICIECKLTQSEAALFQIADLYRPLLTKIYGRPVVGVVACRNLVYDPGRWRIGAITEVLSHRQPDTFVWHWLGRG